MERKTKVIAEEGKQELTVLRDFNLPVELLFRAYVEPEIVEQWMGTKVMKLEAHTHGSWHFITTDPRGNAHGFNGTFHKLIPNQTIIRTFEMENSHFVAQLEFLDFESTGSDTSRLRMHVIYRSAALRDQMLQLPFAQGINMAHNRIEEIMNKLK